MTWIPDLDRWAEVVATLLRPGGRLMLSEFHPFAGVFADETRTLEFDNTLFARFDDLVMDGGRYLVPEGKPSIPLMFALVASSDR